MTLGFDPSEYGRHIGSVYDEIHAARTPDIAVDLIAGYAGGGAVLEFGIGTGRLALPLAARGVQVDGIDGSPEMVAQLRAKPGGADLRVEVGDFATTGTGLRYRAVVLAFDTINALPTQDAQVATFGNAAAHLEPGGVFVVENWVPDLSAFHRGRAVQLHDLSRDRVVVEVAELHPAGQRLTTT